MYNRVSKLAESLGGKLTLTDMWEVVGVGFRIKCMRLAEVEQILHIHAATR